MEIIVVVHPITQVIAHLMNQVTAHLITQAAHPITQVTVHLSKPLGNIGDGAHKLPLLTHVTLAPSPTESSVI